MTILLKAAKKDERNRRGEEGSVGKEQKADMFC